MSGGLRYNEQGWADKPRVRKVKGRWTLSGRLVCNPPTTKAYGSWEQAIAHALAGWGYHSGGLIRFGHSHGR